MKILKLFFAVNALSFVFACGNSVQQKSEPNDAPKNDSVATAGMAYICPMKCEGSGSDKPGKCKVCGMDLVENK